MGQLDVYLERHLFPAHCHSFPLSLEGCSIHHFHRLIWKGFEHTSCSSFALKAWIKMFSLCQHAAQAPAPQRRGIQPFPVTHSAATRKHSFVPHIDPIRRHCWGLMSSLTVVMNSP